MRKIFVTSIIFISLLVSSCSSAPPIPYWQDSKWQADLVSEIGSHIVYPYAGWKEGFPSGTGTVGFTYENGILRDAHIVKSTGSALLDKTLIMGIDTTPAPLVAPNYSRTPHQYEMTFELNPAPEDFEEFVRSPATDIDFPDSDFPASTAIVYVDAVYSDGKWSSLKIQSEQGGADNTGQLLLDAIRAATLPEPPPALKGMPIPLHIRYCIGVDINYCLRNSLKNSPDFRGISTIVAPSDKPSPEMVHLSEGAESGDVDSEYALAKLYETRGGNPQDYLQAFQWYRKAALAGHAQAQNQLNYLYDEGLGVPTGGISLIKKLTELANQGAPDAQTYLGWWYTSSSEIASDSKLGVYWLTKAADQGYAKAEYLLGLQYKHGEGVPMDYLSAMLWFQKSASAGYPNANNMIGKLYEEGDGVAKDDVIAASWYRRSAPNMWLAKCNLLRMYLTKGLKPISKEEIDAWTNPDNQDVDCYNAISWQLATSSSPMLRDPAKALDIIKLGIKRAKRTWFVLDTLAAAQAANGDFKGAVASELDAIQERKVTGARITDLDDMWRRVALYDDEQAYTLLDDDY